MNKVTMLVLALGIAAFAGCTKEPKTITVADNSGASAQMQPVVLSAAQQKQAEQTMWEKLTSGQNPFGSSAAASPAVIMDSKGNLESMDLTYTTRLESAMGNREVKALDYAENLVHIRSLRLNEAIDKKEMDKVKPLAFSLAEARQKQLEAMKMAQLASNQSNQKK